MPIGHRLVADIMGRRRHPMIEVSFKVVISPPKQTPAYSFVTTATAELIIIAKNTGRVLAHFVNAELVLPDKLVKNLTLADVSRMLEAKQLGITLKENRHQTRTYHVKNVDHNVVEITDGSSPTSPSGRYDPILPGMTHQWAVDLNQSYPKQHDSGVLDQEGMLIKWTVFADSASPVTGDVALGDIQVVDKREVRVDPRRT